jgi:hypothetical protein
MEIWLVLNVIKPACENWNVLWVHLVSCPLIDFLDQDQEEHLHAFQATIGEIDNVDPTLIMAPYKRLVVWKS